MNLRTGIWLLFRLCGPLAAAVVVIIALAGEGLARQKPFLRLDTGGHMALVRDMVFTPDRKRLITTSDDKTIRVWDVAEKRTIMTLRGDIDAADGGKVYELALSADGRFLAAAGHTGIDGAASHPVRLYDLATGKIVRLFSAHREPVLSVDFSPDGRFLATAGMDDTAIVWNVKTGRVMTRVRHPSGDINAVRFTADSRRLVTGGDDSHLRLWRVGDGRLLKVMKGHDKLIGDIAVSPAGDLIASGNTGGEIRLWDQRTGEAIKVLARLDQSIPSLTFSPDGKRLLVGAGGPPFTVRVIAVPSGRVELAYNGHDNIVFATAISRDGKVAATAGGNDNEIHLWTLDNPKRLAVLKGLGRAVWSVGISPDGRRIAWGQQGRFRNPNDRAPLTHVLRLPGDGRGLGNPRKLTTGSDRFPPPPVGAGDLALSHSSQAHFGYWDSIDIARSGRVIARARRGEKDGYAHNAYGFAPGNRIVLSGAGHGWLSAYDLKGRKLRDYIGHSGDVWSIAASADARLLVSGSDDQTLRIWNLKTGENIASLFYARNGEWVMWTPQGYFDASPDGDDLIGWHINQGADKPARLITAAQLKRHFYRPDIIRRALELASATAALAEAPDATFALDQLLTRKPPQLRILSPRQGDDVATPSAHIRLAVAANLDPVTGFEMTVNDRRVNLKGLATGAGKAFETTVDAPLQPGLNTIAIAATNAVGRTVTTIRVRHSGAGAVARRGTLYVIAIGVNDYKFFDQDLRFAAADASAFAKSLSRRAQGLYRRIEPIIVADGSGTSPNARGIRKALGVFARARPEDTVVLFLAGHGVNQGRDYLFLPNDARFDAKVKRWDKSSVIDWRVLQRAIETAQGRRIMVVDTCKAGNAYNPRLIKDADDANIAILAATDAETLAQERSDLGHGVFTYSILEGLKGAADLTPDRLIRIREMARFVTDRVKQMTKARQAPTARLPARADFVLSRL